MTIVEMHNEFRQAGDRLDASTIPDMLVEQVDYLLNEAIVRFVKTRYSGNNEFKMGFEEIQKRTDDLKTVSFTDFPLVTTVTTETNTFKASLSTLYTDEALTTLSTRKYWFYTRGRARVVKSGCTSTYVSIRLYQHDDLDDVMLDPFNKPIIDEVAGYFEAGDLYIITSSGTTIDRVKLSYVKKPIEVRYGAAYPTPVSNIDCDLPEHTHKEIIQLAVTIALENIESKRLETQMALKQTIE
jgi:phosphoribosyl-AMP cyclohydrolase